MFDRLNVCAPVIDQKVDVSFDNTAVSLRFASSYFEHIG